MPTMRPQRQGMGFMAVCLAAASLALVMSVLWLFGASGQVYACKCAQPGTPTEELEKFSAVFAGSVVSVQHSYDLNAGLVTPEDRSTVGFEVSAVWKGAVHEDMYITTPPIGGSCGFTFVEGEEYIVYAYDSSYDDGGYTVGICSRTALLAQAQDDLDALGGGDAPRPGTAGPLPEQPQDSLLSRAWVVILIVAAAVVVVGGIVLSPRVRRR